MIGPSFTNLFMQPSTTQSSTGFVAQQPNPYSSLPPYIIPQIPTVQSGSPFSMQNLLANLSGSTSTMGGPQIDKQQLATGVQDIKDSKNQKLSLMLYALGGALKGDKDFVQNTLALQQMQEGKKKQEAQKKKYEEFLAKLPDGSFKDLATALGPSKLDDLLLERYKAETKGIDDTARQREYSQLQSILEDPNKTPEEKALAKKFFAGITGGKSKEQTIRELVASLAKTINPYTQQLYTPDEISAQIQQIDPLLSGTYGQQSPQPAPESFGYKKYKVTPEG